MAITIDGNKFALMERTIKRTGLGNLLGVMVNGSPNSLVKKSCVGILHIFTHIPTHPLFSRYLDQKNGQKIVLSTWALF